MSTASAVLTRIRIATVAVRDLATTERLYDEWLGYGPVERGTVPPALAASWGAPAAAGRRYALLASSEEDVFIRAVETDPVPGYRAMTTWGWNSIEIIVEDVRALSERLRASPFVFLDEPRPLKNYPSIVAVQLKGPSEEVLYLTMQTDRSDDALLPRPRAFVGRPFIAVLAGASLDAMLGWYEAAFGLERRPRSSVPVGVIQRAQGLGPDHAYPLATMKLGRHGNLIEYDEYPAGFGPRPRAEGQLPPGVAMHSFGLTSFDAVDLPYLTPPRVHDGLGYDGRRAATVVGPAGELVELIEE